MEILYRMDSIKELRPIPYDNEIIIRWLKMPDDYAVFYEHLRDRDPNSTFSLADYARWEELGAFYCGLFKDGKMVARAAVEKYKEDTWETADVRTNRAERGYGYAKQICSFKQLRSYSFSFFVNK